MKYNYNIDNEIALLEKYELSPNELFVLKLVLLLQDGDTNYLKRWLQINDGCDFRDIIISLQNKRMINKDFKVPNKGEEFNPYDIPINKLVTKTFFRASFDLGEELYLEYPQFTIINGSQIPLRTVAKKFNSLEDAYRFYAKQIKYNPTKHQEILDLVKWAKENNILQMSLASFIINNSWNDLVDLKQGGSNINYNAVKLI